MSRDRKYLIQLEGPFGDTEVEDVLKKLNDIGWNFKLWAYDTITGETKWSKDEEVLELIRATTPIQILARYDDDFWEEIFRYKSDKINLQTIK